MLQINYNCKIEMYTEEASERPKVIVATSRILSLVGYLVIVGSCLYALLLICRRKETRFNVFLLGTISFFLVLSVTYLVYLYLIYTSKEYWYSVPLSHVIQMSYLASHWFFQALLLKTALTLPLMFQTTKKENETLEEMAARNKK